MKTLKLKTSFIIALLICSFVFGQTQDQIRQITADYDIVKINTLVDEFQSKSIEETAYAEEYALKNNIPLILEENGKFASLQGILSDGTPIYYTTANVGAARSTRANHLHSGGSLGLNLEGENLKVYVWDGGLAPPTHQEYGGRYIIGPGQQNMSSDLHATHVAGTILSSGVNPDAKGMAPKSLVIGYDWAFDKPEAAAAALEGMLVSNHSYGYFSHNLPSWVFGAYNAYARDWDVILYNAPYYLMVVAAMNEGLSNYNTEPLEGLAGYDKLSGQGVTKNNLVVANAIDAVVDNAGNLISVNIYSTSSQGPTDDYRVKPDITGNGYWLFSTTNFNDATYAYMTGTSMASPNVAGTLILLQEYYNELNGRFMKASTLKGLALHTADNTQSSFGAGPNAVWGWGLMNAKRAAETIKDAFDDDGAIIQEMTLSQGQTYQFTVESDGINDLMASISWTDPPGVAVDGILNDPTPVLVNDLDIRITQDNNTFYPWKLTGVTTNGKGDNIVDPFERIDIPSASGSYTVTVSHKGVLNEGSQDYSLIVTGITDTSICLAAVVLAEDVANCGEGEVSLRVKGNDYTTELRLYASETDGSPLDIISGKEGILRTPYTDSTTTYYVTASDGDCESERIPVETIITGENIDFTINFTEFPNESENCEFDYFELSVEGLNEIQSTHILFEENFGGLKNELSILLPLSDLRIEIKNSDNAGGSAPEIVLFGNQQHNNSGEWVIFSNTGEIIEPTPIDISLYSDLEMSFKYAFEGYQLNDYSANISLEVSTDNVDYFELWSNKDISSDISATTVDLDLSDYEEETELYFRFIYYGDSFGVGNLWMDDIKIIGKKEAYQVTWYPADGLFTDSDLTVPYTGEDLKTVYTDSSVSYQSYYTNVSDETCSNSEMILFNSDINFFIAENGDWSDIGNWSAGSVPDINQCIRVPNEKKLIIDTKYAESKAVTLEDGGQVTINADGVLTVSDFIENNSTAEDFVIEDGGILLQNNSNSINSGQILAKKAFRFSNNRQQYNFTISPVTGQSIKHIYENAEFVLEYHENDNFFYNAGDGEYTLTNPAKGFAIKEATGNGILLESAEFIGVPFNGDADFILSRSAGNDYGYNLVGNPYPSNIDIQALYNINNAVIGTEFWFWDNRGNTQHEQQGSGYSGVNYAKYNAFSDTGSAATVGNGKKKIPNKFVNTGTAFMVRALENTDGETLEFTNDIRTSENGFNFFGKGNTNEKDRYWLTMTAPTGITTMAAVVYFENGSDGYGLDDTNYSGASDEIYTIADGHRLTIQGRAPFRKYDVVQMGLNGFLTGLYTFSLYDYEGVFANGQHIYVRDKKLNMIHDLTEGDFSIRLRAGRYDDRFELIYKKLNLVFEVLDIILVFKQGNEIVITSNGDNIQEVNLYNALGLPVYQNTKVRDKELRIPAETLGKQVLVAYIKTENGEVTVKKIINK